MMEKGYMTINEYDEIIEKTLLPLLGKKFEESYPDTFVKCRTHDEQVYKTSNGCMYSWYIKISNGLYGGNFSPKYKPKFSEEHLTYDYSIITDFINDFDKSDNWQSFIIENVEIGFA